MLTFAFTGDYMALFCFLEKKGQIKSTIRQKLLMLLTCFVFVPPPKKKKKSSLTDYLCQVSQLTGHTLEVNPSQHSEHHCTQMKEAIINTADGAVYK